MSQRKQTSNAQSNVNVKTTMQHDERDATNAFKFTTSNDVENVKHDAMINALMHNDINKSHDDKSTSTLTLKQIIERNKIKCDSKLIRRVLRKYYASQINHQKRDAWVFNASHEKNVVELIDKHCRSMKSSNA